MIENFYKDLEISQSTLRTTQDELETKKAECVNHQDEIQNLFSQVKFIELEEFFLKFNKSSFLHYQVIGLQQKVKLLTSNNIELQSNNETSTANLLSQVNFESFCNQKEVFEILLMIFEG